MNRSALRKKKQQEQIEDMENLPTTKRDLGEHKNPRIQVGTRVRTKHSKHPATVQYVQFAVPGFPGGWWVEIKHEHAF